MTFKTTFTAAPKTKADTAVILIGEDSILGPAGQALDQKTNGLLDETLSRQKNFTGKCGQTLTLPVSAQSDYHRVVLIGTGKNEKQDAMVYETAGGKLYTALLNASAEKIRIFVDAAGIKTDITPEQAAAHLLNGLFLASYKFEKYKTEAGKDSSDTPQTRPEKIELITQNAKEAEQQYERLHAAAQGTIWARNLVNEPPNMLYPDSFATMIKDELKPLGVEVEIFDEKKMEKLGFKAHLAVGMGSSRKPRVVVMRWNGADKKKEQPLAFIGKGVTFDTGGVNLKPSGGMEDMKLDMGGAAAVAGLMKTLALRKAKTDVVGIVGLAENMVSSTAYRPSDVIGSLSGKTIEVSNTDAEGRLVLADAITYVQKVYKPQLMVDLATLTGAMMVALGYEYCGTFVNDNDMWTQMEQAGQNTGEKLWRMPLDEAYRKEMDSSIADIKTLGSSGRFAGACTAAGFLERFVEKDVKWAHMDIAGVAWIKSDRPTCPKPGTGFGVRILDRMISDHYES